MDADNQIIRDARALTEHFIPSRVLHREGHVSALSDCLAPIVHKKPGRHSFLYGPPGSGKTCIARYVCEELTAQTSLASYAYVNCWKNSSRFKILFTVLHELGTTISVHRKGTPTDELVDVLRKRARDRNIIVILDEIDKTLEPEVLYDFLSTENITLIMVANDAAALYKEDARVRSRLSSAENVEFAAYRPDELLDILKDRAELGLVPGVVRKAQLERIADIADGDARVAIDTLRVAAEIAENKDEEVITDTIIEKALPKARASSETKAAELLGLHESVLFDIIKERKEIEPALLYEEYEKRLRGMKQEPMVERTLRKYMDRLVTRRLVESHGEGRWRLYKAMPAG